MRVKGLNTNTVKTKVMFSCSTRDSVEEQGIGRVVSVRKSVTTGPRVAHILCTNDAVE